MKSRQSIHSALESSHCWLKATKGSALSWKIQALKSDGSLLRESETRSLQLKARN
jgi:hypothetical protein